MERCQKNHQKCPWKARKLGCHLVSHHIYFPASAYERGLETEFRELDINRVDMCKFEEEQVHDAFPFGVPKPTSEVMQHIVERERLKRDLERGNIERAKDEYRSL